MRRVTCKDCKHAYDYDKDDFCPRCGSYNPPPDTGSTRLEQELLSRFGAARAAQDRAAQQARSQQPQQVQPSRYYQRPAQWTPHPKAPQGHANHTPVGGAVRCEERPRKGQNSLIAAVAVIMVAITLVIGTALMAFTNLPGEWDFFSGSVRGPYSESTWAVGDTFPLNDVTVTIDGAWWVDTEGTLLAREGCGLLLVDVWIEGGTYDAKAQISSPYLLAPDGETYPLEDGADLAKRVKTQTGAYVVDLRDYMWEDPLCGSFAFYVPEGTAQAVLCLEELDSRGEVAALNQVELDLPAR